MKWIEKRRRKHEQVVATLRIACRHPVEGKDMLPAILENLFERSRGAVSAPMRRRWPLWTALVATGAAAASAGLVLPSPTQRYEKEGSGSSDLVDPTPTSEIANANIASRSVPSGDAEEAVSVIHATVLGPEPLIIALAGETRTLFVGAPVPFGVPIQPVHGEGGTLRLRGRADVRLDPGAEIEIDEPSDEFDGISLQVGRIAVRVEPSPRPLRVRLRAAGVAVQSNAGAFGVLAAKGARWSAAVSSGSAQIPASALSRALGPASRTAAPLVVTAGHMVGGGGGLDVAVRPLSEEIRLESNARVAESGWILHGLADALSEVRADGIPLAVQASGAFRHSVAAGTRSIRIAALDAAGRRVERRIAAPRAAGEGGARRRESAARALGGPRDAAPTNDPSERPRIEVLPPDWLNEGSGE